MKIAHVGPIIGLFGILLSLTSCKNQQAEAQETNAGRKLVREAIEAHGGIEKWRNNGSLQFRWSYHMTDRDRVADSLQVVNPITYEATHSVPDSEMKFGRAKDGSYWVSPPEATFFPPVQFWTLTPIYFIGIPFVFEDDQINYELLSDPKEFQGKDYTQVKITYQTGAGESADDFYVMLIDPETKLVRGAYYIVTNPLVYKGGPTIEKFISLDNLTEVGGLLLAGGHKTYSMTDGVIGDQLRFTEVSDVKFLKNENVDFSVPEGAKILEPVPKS